MVNVTCCGGQDRNTTTRESRPYEPPHETRNCYLRTQPGNRSTFDYSQCNRADTACTGDNIPIGSGGCLACHSSSGGGYCDIDGDYYSSKGMGRQFHELDDDEIGEITRSSGSSDIGEMSRLFERESQRMFNRQMNYGIRNQQRRSSSTGETTGETTRETKQSNNNEEETTITDYITEILLYIGISATFILMVLSIVLILLK